MSNVPCHNHATEPAEESCSRCLQPFCAVCIRADGIDWYCMACLRTIRRRRAVVRTLLGLLGLAGLGVGIWYLTTQVTWDPEARKIAPQTKVLAADNPELAVPDCNRTTIIERGEALMRVDRYQDALTLAGNFFSKCGEFPRLRWVTYGAHKRLSQWEQAAAEATRLIEHDPYDHDFRWWRGFVYEQQGDLERAIADYRQALSITPQLNSIPLNLATLLERVGRPCEAIFPIEQLLHYHPEARRQPRIQAQLRALYGSGACRDTQGQGRAVLRYHPGETQIRCRAKFNGQHEGEFIVDTGASLVALSRPFATRLGLDRVPTSPILVQTASGMTSGQLTAVDRIELQGAQAARVDVAILDGLPEGLDGLLGLSFLSRFHLNLDSAKGQLTISRREEQLP